jgi:hypothetical protein
MRGVRRETLSEMNMGCGWGVLWDVAGTLSATAVPRMLQLCVGHILTRLRVQVRNAVFKWCLGKNDYY